MGRKNVEVLVVFPEPSGLEMHDNYFTNDTPRCVVVFPIEGTPTAIFPPGATWAGPWLMAKERGEALVDR